MSSAGFKLVAGRIPGERIATTTRSASSSAVTTTETEIDSVDALLVSGRTYRVRWVFSFTVSTATDHHLGRIREDSSSGTQIQARRLSAVTTQQSYPGMIEVEYTATASGSKTFSATFQRSGGAGSITSHSASDNPSYLYVDYIRG